MTDDGLTIYERIVMECNKRKITPSKLCTMVGLPRSTISESRKRDNMMSRNIALFAEGLEVSCDYLIRGCEFTPSYSPEERQLVLAYRLCTDEEKETIAFMLRKYGMPMPQEEPISSISEAI